MCVRVYWDRIVRQGVPMFKPFAEPALDTSTESR